MTSSPCRLSSHSCATSVSAVWSASSLASVLVQVSCFPPREDWKWAILYLGLNIKMINLLGTLQKLQWKMGRKCRFCPQFTTCIYCVLFLTTNSASSQFKYILFIVLQHTCKIEYFGSPFQAVIFVEYIVKSCVLFFFTCFFLHLYIFILFSHTYIYI